MRSFSNRFEKVLPRLEALWERLTKPSPALTDFRQVYRARALAGATLVTLPLLSLIIFVALPVAISDLPNNNIFTQPMFYIGLATLAVVGVSYRLSRSTHVHLGGLVFAGWLIAAVYASAVLGDVDAVGRAELLTWLAFAVLLGGFFLSARLIAMIGLVCLSGVIVFPLVGPDEVSSYLIGVQTFIGGISLATFVLSRQREKMEKERYDSIENYQTVLEEDVVRRTTELEQTKHDLKELLAVKDEFVGSVSHELRTPVTALKLNLTLLKMAPQRHAEIVERVQREAERLEFLIEDLLRVSRLDRQQPDLRQSEFDLNHLIQVIATDRKVLADKKSLRLTIDTSRVLPRVTADERMIAQTISILLTNALSYTPEKGEVRITSMLDETRTCPVGFEVSDSGLGVPDNEQGRIFERFFRGAAALESGVAGTGLGLSLAQSIVGWHTGEILYAGAGVDGRGAAFQVWLPKQ